MTSYIPPKIPLSPKQAAARRARIIARVKTAAFGVVIVLPILFALMAYGYSDQAPAALRSFTITLDSAIGSPVWRLIGPAR
jgi:hypothetical protein